MHVTATLAYWMTWMYDDHVMFSMTNATMLQKKVVWLAAESFFYGQIDRATTKAKRSMSERFPEIGRKFHRLGLPPKVTMTMTCIRIDLYFSAREAGPRMMND